MKKLTKRQIQVMTFIMTFLHEEDRFPTTREITKHLNITSQTSAVGHLRALVKKGFLEERTSPGRIRGWLRIARAKEP